MRILGMDGNMNVVSEEKMVACLHSNNQQEFSKLYDVYSPMLMGMIIKIVGAGLAKDILQKTFIYAWKNRDEYHSQSGRIITWLIKSARLVIQKENLSKESSTSNLPVYNQTVKADCEQHQSWVFESVYYQGNSIAEISNQLKIEEETLKLMLRKAVQKLKSNTSK